MLTAFLLTLPLFTPPTAWEMVESKEKSAYVMASFVSKEVSSFRPSINLAKEEVDISLKEYVQSVKKLHLIERNKTWRDLGQFQMIAGDGRLTEIRTKTQFGEIQAIQAFFLNGKTIYILTATSKQTDFPRVKKEILEAFHSFTIEDSIFSALHDKDKLFTIQKIFKGLEQSSLNGDPSRYKEAQWEHFQRDIVNLFPEMGGYWQSLALKEGLFKLTNSRNQQNE